MSSKRDSSMKPFVIMALNTGKSVAEEQRFLSEWLTMKGYGECGTKAVTGMWQGVAEHSWLITLPMNLHDRVHVVESIKRMAGIHQQDAILYSDTRRNSYLFWLDGKGACTEALGVFLNVTKARAEQLDCYTYDPQRDTYWITSPDTARGMPFCDLKVEKPSLAEVKV